MYKSPVRSALPAAPELVVVFDAVFAASKAFAVKLNEWIVVVCAYLAYKLLSRCWVVVFASLLPRQAELRQLQV